jgi:molybdenum cofactor cytidylyltransferase
MSGIIILAAGASTRLGKPKQLLHFNDKSLLQHAIDTAESAEGNPVIVVLGSSAGLIQAALESERAQIVINENWQDGMSSSICCGLKALINSNPKIEEVILLLADQPFIASSLLTQLKEKKMETGKSIVACTYKNHPGVPALFSRDFFPALLSLKGPQGARKLFFEFPDSLACIPFPLGSIDIDTIEDYTALLENERKSGKDFFNSWC